MPACAVCGYEAAEAFKFCPECGAAAAVASGQEQRKTVTVLFCDVVGSTALGELTDPEALRALLASYFDRMKEIVEHHGGTVEKFIGDAVMAVFGVPIVHEDDALRACRAAVEMREALPELRVEGRIGLTTGEVVTGTEERLATGDAVNVAARLQQAAQPGEVLLGEATLELMRDRVEVEALEPLELKGKAQPVTAYRLIAVQEEPTRRHEVRFVGREQELTLIQEAWERARLERRCELVTIVGEAGVGKSRLVAEALASVEARIVQGRCLPYGDGITYWPVVEVIKQLDVLPSDPAAASGIRSLLGETSAGASAEEIAWAFRKLLEEQAPLVCVLDDIQWGEQTFLDLLEHVALLSSGSPILLLCMARPELVERRPGWPVALRLEPLRGDQVDELIGERVEPRLRQRIAHAAGGNPLFVSEILVMAEQADGEVLVPPSLRALLAARLDQLETSERRVLERGAIEGELFHRGAVQALAPEESQVTPRLATLVRKKLIRPERAQLPGEDGFRFCHLLIRDAAYDGLPKSARAELHERFAAWLEERRADLVELDEILGYHLEQAHRYLIELSLIGERSASLAIRAAESLAAAGRAALARSDVSAAGNLLERATKLLPGDDPARRRLLVDLAEALSQAGDLARSEEILGQAIAAGKDAGDSHAEWLARIGRHSVRLIFEPEGAGDEALKDAEAAIAARTPDGDHLVLARAWRLIAGVHWLRAEGGATDEAAQRALEHAKQAADPAEIVAAVLASGSTVGAGPVPVSEGIRRVEEIQRLMGAFPAVHEFCLHVQTHLLPRQGRFEEGRKIVTQWREMLRERGLKRRYAVSANCAFDLFSLSDDWAGAEETLREAVEILEGMGEKTHLSGAAELLAKTLCHQGKLDEAERYSVLSEEAGSRDDLTTQVGWRVARASVRMARADLGEAERLAREALSIASGTDMLDMHAGALLALAEVLVLRGRPEDAAGNIAQALELYEQKGNSVMSGKTRARFAELTTAASQT